MQDIRPIKVAVRSKSSPVPRLKPAAAQAKPAVRPGSIALDIKVKTSNNAKLKPTSTVVTAPEEPGLLEVFDRVVPEAPKVVIKHSVPVAFESSKSGSEPKVRRSLISRFRSNKKASTEGLGDAEPVEVVAVNQESKQEEAQESSVPTPISVTSSPAVRVEKKIEMDDDYWDNPEASAPIVAEAATHDEIDKAFMVSDDSDEAEDNYLNEINEGQVAQPEVKPETPDSEPVKSEREEPKVEPKTERPSGYLVPKNQPAVQDGDDQLEAAAQAAQDSLQDPKIYDTKHYHVPITHSNSGGLKGKLFYAGAALVAVAAVALVLHFLGVINLPINI